MTSHSRIERTEGETAANNAIGDKSRENNVGEAGKGKGEDKEKNWRHYETQTVHGEIVVYAMSEKVEYKEGGFVR